MLPSTSLSQKRSCTQITSGTKCAHNAAASNNSRSGTDEPCIPQYFRSQTLKREHPPQEIAQQSPRLTVLGSVMLS